MPPPSPDDAGSATALAAFAVAALVTVAVGAIWIGAAVIARHRAQAAADLAALAAAQRLAAGPDAACGEAAGIGRSMGAVMRGCEVVGLDVVVTLGLRVGGPVRAEARASARAGPV